MHLRNDPQGDRGLQFVRRYPTAPKQLVKTLNHLSDSGSIRPGESGVNCILGCGQCFEGDGRHQRREFLQGTDLSMGIDRIRRQSRNSVDQSQAFFWPRRIWNRPTCRQSRRRGNRFTVLVEYPSFSNQRLETVGIGCSVCGESMPERGHKGIKIVIQSRGNKLTQFGADPILA